ncbi:MAG: DUF3006 domain-containing protein [Pseudomonadales bacterium]|jgi:multidrug resistance efflux pump|nr:DUF3006 domain-containing protein [Pseudomonadales bacterium]
MYIVDRVEGDVAVCENISSGEVVEIKLQNLPESVKEGDALVKTDDGKYVVDGDTTKKRLDEMTRRMERLFEKNK